ncbi:hypothetical protein BDP81DRAFT_441599 [Colletotrichum phormii]|uniref:Secreted protein n=1 Tax=Colletotrichum phormii TaxID=359342 RepID=A0AAI9ZDR3_9PEZI|nr:uncharacterized protein BDP81DRAFT_441599 [Colletotrichum phormii]KAK1622387.1 hypothetical protein BDP81DRAFT_441599 [Colletotrichum phormii]
MVAKLVMAACMLAAVSCLGSMRCWGPELYSVLFLVWGLDRLVRKLLRDIITSDHGSMIVRYSLVTVTRPWMADWCSTSPEGSLGRGLEVCHDPSRTLAFVSFLQLSSAFPK